MRQIAAPPGKAIYTSQFEHQYSASQLLQIFHDQQLCEKEKNETETGTGNEQREKYICMPFLLN
jgi:hypothetical protein